MDNIANNGWAQGCFFHQMITCMNHEWHETSFPWEALVHAQVLPSAERIAILVPAMQKEHKSR